MRSGIAPPVALPQWEEGAIFGPVRCCAIQRCKRTERAPYRRVTLDRLIGNLCDAPASSHLLKQDASRARVYSLIGDDEVDAAVKQRPQALGRPVDDRFLVNIEARIDQNRQPGGIAKPPQNVGEQRIVFVPYDLRSRRAVDVDHGRDSIAPLRPYRAGDGHEMRRVAIHWRNLEHPGGVLIEDVRSKGHEFRPFQPLVQVVVDGVIVWRGNDATVAERAGAVFHTSDIDGANLAGTNEIGCKAGRIAAVSFDAGG